MREIRRDWHELDIHVEKKRRTKEDQATASRIWLASCRIHRTSYEVYCSCLVSASIGISLAEEPPSKLANDERMLIGFPHTELRS
jgi:hypothetical protein